jgi:hypothetical protein
MQAYYGLGPQVCGFFKKGCAKTSSFEKASFACPAALNFNKE